MDSSWVQRSRVVTPQPKLLPQPLNAAPMKNPSHRLWKKSPMFTPANKRTFVDQLVVSLLVSASTFCSTSFEGGTARWLNKSITAGSIIPAKIAVPHLHNTSTSSVQPTATK